MVYHANSAWLPGGFLGVEVFFVICGYLITLLLIAEHERTGTVNLRQLLDAAGPPAAPGAVRDAVRVTIYTALFRRDDARPAARRRRRRAGLRLQLVPDLGRAGLHRGRRLRAAAPPVEPRRRGAVLPDLAARDGRPDRASGAVGSPRSSRWLFLAAVAITVVDGAPLPPGPDRDAARSTPDAYWQIAGRCIAKADALYLSTFTRAGGLLLGAAFAMVWRPVALMRGPMRDKGRLLDVRRASSAWPGSALMMLVPSHIVDARRAPTRWLFRGGFLLTGDRHAGGHRRGHPPRALTPGGARHPGRCCGSAPGRTACTCTTGRSTS